MLNRLQTGTINFSFDPIPYPINPGQKCFIYLGHEPRNVLFLAVRFSLFALPVGGIAKMVSDANARSGELMIQVSSKHTYPDFVF
jgi:hypothetical protein